MEATTANHTEVEHVPVTVSDGPFVIVDMNSYEPAFIASSGVQVIQLEETWGLYGDETQEEIFEMETILRTNIELLETADPSESRDFLLRDLQWELQDLEAIKGRPDGREGLDD